MFFLVLMDADCSGRALATLLVAWVLTAMIASILLRWDYMWIVLMVLTMLVLLVCGYTAYNVKKAHARLLLEEQRRAAIRTISGMTAATRREQESSVYAAHLSVDLPPSYASVVAVQTPTSAPTILTIDRSGDDKYEDPPSYAIVVASLDTQDRCAETSGLSNVQPFAPAEKNSTAPATISASNSYVCSHSRQTATITH
ncbi:uncharacterized protein [Linepithema humile]|uniref:uncharacterized protein isoform X2 n=2 Tax=Linepithema humile TaxID=83485 RepID=UPI0006231C09|nr:PREDICTED: uncharacterized protein LOC105679699 isoform X2 [Linepithema humile]